jgi:hypothetical protein
MLLITFSATSCLSYSSQVQLTENAFELSHKDIKFIQDFYREEIYKNLLKLPSKTSRPKVTQFFILLKDQQNTKWIKAYLFLLKIVPEISINEETDC